MLNSVTNAWGTSMKSLTQNLQVIAAQWQWGVALEEFRGKHTLCTYPSRCNPCKTPFKLSLKDSIIDLRHALTSTHSVAYLYPPTQPRIHPPHSHPLTQPQSLSHTHPKMSWPAVAKHEKITMLIPVCTIRRSTENRIVCSRRANFPSRARYLKITTMLSCGV